MRWIRRIVFGIFLLAGGWLLAFGPRPQIQRPKDRITIQYWEKWTGNEAADMQQIVDDFNRTVGAEKNIYVEYLSMSGVDHKTLIATSAGLPPDVAGLFQEQLAQFASIGALEPLDARATAAGITRDYYKPVYWKGCQYRDRLYALISTPVDLALYYNKRIFQENAAQLRAAGCDPDRAPRTLAELDRYATALDQRDANGRIIRAGYAPLEPGWYLAETPLWFNGKMFDESTQKFELTSPQCVRALDWIKSYSVRLGTQQLAEFHAGAGNFNSVTNPFLSGQIAMIQQGPFMARFIEDLKPSMSHVKFPKSMDKDKTPEERQANCEWGVAPFPSVFSDKFTTDAQRIDQGATYCDFDVLTIPRGCKHPDQAFEFIAFVNRQDEMEKLCALHFKNTPLAKNSPAFFKNHPNPYIAVFDRLASSPNARALPSIPIWPEVKEELVAASERVSLLRQEPADALAQAQARLQPRIDQFDAASAGAAMKAGERTQMFKGLAFVSPWVIGFAMFLLVPIALSFYYSLCEYTGLSSPQFIGLANYRQLLHDEVFWQALWNTIRFAAMALPAGLLISLGLALLLNSPIPGQPIFRTIIFVPSLVPAVAAAMVWLWIYNPLGLINTFLAKFGINGPAWLQSVNLAMPALAFMSFWGVGYTVVIFLAGLQDVPRELYEAAEIDGASSLRRLWHVTLPLLSPVIFFNLIMAIIGTFQVFSTPYIMTSGGPARSTYFYTMFVFDSAFYHAHMGYASAMAWIQLLLILLLTGLAFLTSKRWVHYQG